MARAISVPSVLRMGNRPSQQSSLGADTRQYDAAPIAGVGPVHGRGDADVRDQSLCAGGGHDLRLPILDVPDLCPLHSTGSGSESRSRGRAKGTTAVQVEGADCPAAVVGASEATSKVRAHWATGRQPRAAVHPARHEQRAVVHLCDLALSPPFGQELPSRPAHACAHDRSVGRSRSQTLLGRVRTVVVREDDEAVEVLLLVVVAHRGFAVHAPGHRKAASVWAISYLNAVV